ncbi:MAG: FCD domain-containing protein [Tagaea sp.]|nr:FCD domain-containing protein [Tagaea sp.]
MTEAVSLEVAAEIASSLEGHPIDRRRLFEEVAERIEGLIVSGRLRPGDKLPSERDLMNLFGIGRTSIREALFALQRKGIVAAQSGGRPVVIEPKAEVIVSELSGAVRLYLAAGDGTREFQRARRLFEPAVARNAARIATDADIVRLRAALDANKAALGDPKRFVDTDIDFHYAVVQLTRSRLLIAMHQAVFEWLREQRTSSIEPGGSSDAAYRAHERVFEAIEARDPDAAESAMLAHLDEVENYYWRSRGDGSKPAKNKKPNEEEQT